MGRRGIITIDGPAGAGKSTVGRSLAQVLQFHYLDSGALYRAVAWQALHSHLDLSEPEGLTAFLADFRPEITSDEQGFHLLLEGEEITRELRTPRVSREASRVATLPQVRRWVTALLRNLAQNGGVVAEGRDMGSVVFPDAEVKIFLTADLATRAARRRQEWQGDQTAIDLEETKTELAERDRQDETRDASPLKVPEGAICLDTTDLTPEEVIEQCLAEIRDALAGPDKQ